MSNSCSSSSEFEQPPKKRKGIRNSANYKNNVRIKSRLHGLKYVNQKGIEKPEKQTGPDCRCRFKCMDKFSEDEKLYILKILYSGIPKNEQDTLLMGLIESKEIQRRRSRNEEPKQERRSSFSYHVLNGSQRVKVCKKAFISLYALSGKSVFRLTSLLLNGTSPIDKCGSHMKRGNAVPDAAVLKINEHINSFPKKETHYGSKPLTYLDSHLTVKKMFELFCSKHNDFTFVKYDYYLKHFNENFGYRFGRPQVDVCPTCEELSVKLKSVMLNETAKRVASAKLIVHKRRASKFYNKLQYVRELCNKNENVGGIVFDFMQNLQLPFMPVNDMFYLRKLWQYVFGIHNLRDDTAKFYTYHEGIALRGANEVATFLQDYINQLPESITELHVFSDACGGQNRNHTIIRFLLSLTMSGRFMTIHQYFPVRGHSFLPCHRDFGIIKRVIRRHDHIYTPMEYVSIIENAKKMNPLFVVKVVNTEDIYDFKSWWPKYLKKTSQNITTRQNTFRESFTVSKYRHLTYKSQSLGYVLTREYIDGLCTNKFCLSKNTENLPKANELAYNAKIPIKSAKLEDAAKIIKYIPLEHQEFFTQFQKWPSTSIQYDSE